MAYGLLLYKEIETPQGSQRVEIYKDGYTGTAVEIAGLHADGITISKDSQLLTQPITTSVLTIRLSDCEEVDYSQFYTPNSTLFKVVWQTINGTTTTTRWTGFITPDSYSENLAYRDTLTLTARDNLGRLNDYDFDLDQGQMLSVRSILGSAMTKAGVAMGLTYTTTKVATSPATVLAVDGLVNTTLLQGMTWHAAVELLLTGLGLTLAWNDGNAFEVRDISQAPASTQQSFFINKSGYRQIRPAWKNIVVGQDYGLRSSFYEGQFTQEQCGDNPTFSIPSSSKWDYGGTIALLNPYKGAAYPYETIYLPIQGGDGMSNRIAYAFATKQISQPIKISFRANNTAWIWQDPADAYGFVGISDRSLLATKQSGQTYTMSRYYIRFRCNVFCNVGGTTYILRDKWQVYDASTIAQPYLYFVMPTVLDEYGNVVAEDQDNEVSIYLGQLPGDGMVSVVFYTPVVQTKEKGDPADVALASLTALTYTTPYAKMTNLTMSVDDGIAGRSMSVTVNPAHNMRGELSVSLGQVPTGKGNTLLYLGGLFYNDTYYTPLTAFARAQNGTNYDLLELVGREYISYQNAAYNALSGTMKQSALFRFDKGISYDGNTYRIVGASLAILSNTLSAQMLQQEASFDTAAHTIEAVDEEGSAQSSTATGGISQGTQAGVDWFIQETYEEDGETRQRLKLNPDYTGMYAEGWITAGGLGSGSGEAGGSLATLADVTLTALAAGDILRYNATTSHWENAQPSLALLADVALGTPADGQALIWDATLGRWRPGTVQGGGGIGSIGLTMPTGFAVAGSPLTSDGTLQVSFANGYALPTTADVAKGTTAYGWGNHANAGYLTTATADGRYGAGLNYAANRLHLVNKDGTSLGYLTADNLVTVLGTAAVSRATNDANGNTIASQTWVTARGYLTSVAFGDLTSHPTTLAGYGITDAKISGGTITLGGNSITPLASVAFADLTSHPTTLSGYGITDAKISGGTITLGANTITPLTEVSVVSGDNTIGTSLTTIGQVQGVNIRAKIDAYLLAADFTAANIVSTLGTTAVNRATADASGNTITSSYLRKDTDDTMSANLTIGQPNLSGSKTLTLYGRNNDTTPALTIYGVASATTRYATQIYRDATALQIGSSIYVNGNFAASGNNVAGTASDRRLKDHIETMGAEQAIGVLKALRPVTFEWNDLAGELGGFSGDSRGFIADEYNRIIGNATRKIWGIYDAIDYQQAIPYLVAGWQALYEEVQRLKRRLGDGI